MTINDLNFCFTAALSIAAVCILVSSIKLKSKYLLLGFIILELLKYVGYYVPDLLLRNEVMTYETYKNTMMFIGVICVILSLLDWSLLLAFIISLKKVQCESANKESEAIQQDTRTTSRIKIVLTSLAYGVIGVPLVCYIFVHVQHGHGMDGKDTAGTFISGFALSTVLILLRLAIRK